PDEQPVALRGEGLEQLSQPPRLGEEGRIVRLLPRVEQELDVPGEAVTLGRAGAASGARGRPRRLRRELAGARKQAEPGGVQEEAADPGRAVAPVGASQRPALDGGPVEAAAVVERRLG